MNAKFEENVAYKINPEFEEDNDIFYLSRFNAKNQNGLYFARMIDGEREAENNSYFTDAELEDGVLIEA